MSTDLLSLHQVFDDGKRIFHVPDYQRGYSWETQHRQDLLNDIKEITHHGFRHFAGTIVAFRVGEEQGLPVFEIVDGQQRLTSLVLLLCQLLHYRGAKDTLDEEVIETLRETFICGGEKEGNTLRKFRLNRDLDILFEQIVLTGSQGAAQRDTKAHTNLLNTITEYTEWLEETPLELADIHSRITEKFGFLFYAPPESSEVGMMFEVINNRGKRLSELEKTKNYLIYFAERNGVQDLRDHVNRKWSKILEHLNEAGVTSNDDENSFLRNCWIVFADTNKSRSYYVYDNLKQWYPATQKGKWRKLVEFVKFLEECSLTYKYLWCGGASEHDGKWLAAIRYHASVASVMPLLLAIFARCKDTATRCGLLEVIEKLSFRYYGCGIAGRSDTGQGELFWLAYQYYNKYHQKNGSVQVDDEWLLRELRGFVQSNAGDVAFIKYLTLDKDESGNYYSWSNLKFFLASYEDHLARKIGRTADIARIMAPQNKAAPNDFYHREHIWATQDYTIFNDESAPDVNKRRLGNFVLLEPSINIRVSNDPVEKKVNEYFDKTLDVPTTTMLRELKQFYQEAVNELAQQEAGCTSTYKYAVIQRFLDRREEKMLQFALERWRVEGLVNNRDRVVINSRIEGNEVYRLFPEYEEPKSQDG